MHAIHSNHTTPSNPTHKVSSYPYNLAPNHSSQAMRTKGATKTRTQERENLIQKRWEEDPQNIVIAINKMVTLELGEQPPPTESTQQRDPGVKINK